MVTSHIYTHAVSEIIKFMLFVFRNVDKVLGILAKKLVLDCKPRSHFIANTQYNQKKIYQKYHHTD